MKFYLDSAFTDEILKAKKLPFFAGVTTNPILLYRAGIKDRRKFYESVLSLIPKKELFVQVFAKEAEEAYREAVALSNLSRERIIIKIPVTNEMTDTAARLTEKGIRVCLTAVSNIRQIAVAGALGIEYCAVYLNRMLRKNRKAYEQITDSDRMISYNSFRTRILVASLPDENLIEPVLFCRNLDFTLPFGPFMNLVITKDSKEWVRGFYEVTDKNPLKR